MSEIGSVDAIVGLYRGDEGKGRFSDMWASQYDDVGRYNGGPNAGHTVMSPDGRVLKLHGIPSGIGNPDSKNVIGDGVFVDANKLTTEIDDLRDKDVIVDTRNLLVSSSAHMILPHHIVRDMRYESGSKAQGSTKSGIRFVAADLASREGVRAEVINNDLDELHRSIRRGLRPLGRLSAAEYRVLGVGTKHEIADKYVAAAEKLGPYVTDTALFLNDELKAGKRVLAEAAQAFLLDNYQGMYPNVTSSITTSGGISPGLGIAPQRIDRVLGVFKAIPSHVGGGHFVTEIKRKADLDKLHGDPNSIDAEVGTTTGRWRRLGYLDLPILRRANMVNGTTEMAITKFDWLPRYGETILVCTGYERKGKTLRVSPNAEYKLKQSTPVYTELPGWEEDVSEVRDFDDLPANAKAFIGFLEDETEVKISMIGVGPRRDQVIVREAA